MREGGQRVRRKRLVYKMMRYMYLSTCNCASGIMYSRECLYVCVCARVHVHMYVHV